MTGFEVSKRAARSQQGHLGTDTDLESECAVPRVCSASPAPLSDQQLCCGFLAASGSEMLPEGKCDHLATQVRATHSAEIPREGVAAPQWVPDSNCLPAQAADHLQSCAQSKSKWEQQEFLLGMRIIKHQLTFDRMDLSLMP